MFIAVALICTAPDLSACSMYLWNDVFIDAEMCEANNVRHLGQMTPLGVVVGTACFKVDALGDPV